MPLNIAFWPHLPDRRIASTRIRCLQLLPALNQLGLNATLFDPSTSAPDRLVLSKRYDEATLTQACELRTRAGTRLVLDLCDNHFHLIGEDPKLLQRRQALASAMARVDAIVASTSALARHLSAHVPDAAHKITVIGDAKDEDAIWGGKPGWRETARILGTRGHLMRHGISQGRRLIWFGNHGSDGVEGGMQDIDLVAPALAQHHAEQPLSLTIVSNNKDKFQRLKKAWAFPSVYIPWSPGITTRLARFHDISVIPAGLNPFTECKSPNRAVTSFLNGLAVVASPIPSYLELFPKLVETNWTSGLRGMMHDAGLCTAQVSAAREIIERQCAVEVVARQWHDLLFQT